MISCSLALNAVKHVNVGFLSPQGKENSFTATQGIRGNQLDVHQGSS